MKKVDLTGQTFGLLTVHHPAGHDSGGGALWSCECECGTTTTVAARNLRQGNTLTCGTKGAHPRPPNPNPYHAIHIHLHKVRGKASVHRCVDCQQPAHDWSWSGPGEVTHDLARFKPRCRRCHVAYDGRAKKRPTLTQEQQAYIKNLRADPVAMDIMTTRIIEAS